LGSGSTPNGRDGRSPRRHTPERRLGGSPTGSATPAKGITGPSKHGMGSGSRRSGGLSPSRLTDSQAILESVDFDKFSRRQALIWVWVATPVSEGCSYSATAERVPMDIRLELGQPGLAGKGVSVLLDELAQAIRDQLA
jgi:hypothetical protein